MLWRRLCEDTNEYDEYDEINEWYYGVNDNKENLKN